MYRLAKGNKMAYLLATKRLLKGNAWLSSSVEKSHYTVLSKGNNFYTTSFPTHKILVPYDNPKIKYQSQ